ncbi:MAG: UbiD family decarboxylase [Candidatus Tectomicrobia bacterium]|nr:UbiD family decarboxylase [Candidatus Tectomicrobia bacterium]
MASDGNVEFSLRGYVMDLARELPGACERLPAPVDRRRQPEGLAAELAGQDRWPVLWGELPGSSPCGVAANLFADRARMAAWFGAPPERLSAALLGRLAGAGRAGMRREAGQAPVRQVILHGEEVDLTALAIPRHGGAGGAVITGGLLITCDPGDGKERICQQRALITSPTSLALPLDHHSQLSRAADAARLRGERLRAVLWIGHHPALVLAAACLGERAEVWERLGAAINRDLAVTPSLSFGKALCVPAEAELALEGEIDPSAREEHAGFPAGNGCTAGPTPALRMEVRCLSRRAEAWWCDVVPEQLDAYQLSGVPLEVALLDEVGRRAPSLRNVHVPPTAGGALHAYLQLKEPRKGEAREAILTALPVDARLKHVFVVDDDVNIFDDREVLWALATRSQWERDVLIMPGLRGSRLDPLAEGGVGVKGGFDCTRPAGESYSERNAVSPSVYAEVRIEDYLDAAHLARIPVERQ